jgi:NADPH-dependent curcumin reductase CurA
MSNLPTTTKSFIVQNSPVNNCDLSLGNATSTFKLVEADLPPVQDGQVLVQVIYISNDPAQRGWIHKDQDAARFYVPPVRQGDLVASVCLVRVLDSKADSLKAGDLALGMVGWRQYGVIDAAELRKVE